MLTGFSLLSIFIISVCIYFYTKKAPEVKENIVVNPSNKPRTLGSLMYLMINKDGEVQVVKAGTKLSEEWSPIDCWYE